MLGRVEANDIAGAVQLGGRSRDSVARVLTYALTHREHSLANAFLRAANRELARFPAGPGRPRHLHHRRPAARAPGHRDGDDEHLRGAGAGTDIASNAGQITGGVAEALIATACGLAIAILALLPYNLLNARVELVRHEISDAANALELLLKKSAPPAAPPLLTPGS